MKTKFVKAVEIGDLVSVRLFIANELMLDPRGNSFNEMKKYAEGKIVNLYEVDIPKQYSSVESEWNDEFMYSVKNDLDENFSREKLEMYERIVKIVLKDKAEELDKEEVSLHSEKVANGTLKEEQALKNDAINNSQLYKGIIVGGVVVAAVGLCTSRIAVTTLGLAGVVVGSLLLYKESKK